MSLPHSRNTPQPVSSVRMNSRLFLTRVIFKALYLILLIYNTANHQTINPTSCCLHASCTQQDKPLINPDTHQKISSRSHCNSLCFSLGLFSSTQKITCARGKTGRHSLKHMSANMAVNFKSNLFSRQELRKIDVHISSINGFHNSLAWWTGASQSLSKKLWQVHSRFSWLIDNQILPVSMSCGTL